MKYSALIGNPTGHSVSYILFRELAKAAKTRFPYEHICVDVDKGRLPQSISAFRELGFVGLNVTLPYKIDIIEYMDELDPVIAELGAVNTVKLGDRVVGHNTDWVGIGESVQQFGGRKDYKVATIFGTGGAARAAIYACKHLGIKDVRVLHRIERSSGTLGLIKAAESLGVTLHEYADASTMLRDSDLIINATSAGMSGQDKLPFDVSVLDGMSFKGKVFMEAVFNPLETPLIKYFSAKGMVTIDGLWMMIYQGVEAMSIWLDSKIDVDVNSLTDIHELLTKELANVQSGH